MLGLVFVSRDFELGRNVGCEELTVSLEIRFRYTGMVLTC